MYGATGRLSVNNEAVVKLSQQEIADTLGFTKSKVNSIIRELIQKGYVTQVNARGKYALTENANRELRNMQSKEACCMNPNTMPLEAETRVLIDRSLE